MLASLTDINTHLPQDKLPLEEGADALYQLDAARMIKAYLSGTLLPTTLAEWVDPDNTPETIRGIAGRLIAALYIRERFAGDSDLDPSLAQNKYNEAMSLLVQVRDGKIILPEVTGDSSIEFSADDAWPNDSTADGPYFTVGQVFG